MARWSRSAARCGRLSFRSSPSEIRRPASLQLSLSFIARATLSSAYCEPSLLQASAQAHAGPVQKHPAVGRRDGKLLTDLGGLDPHHLAHHENPRRVFRKAFQAALEGFEELALGKRRLGIAPFGRHAGVVAVFLVQNIEVLQGSLLARQVEGLLAACAADE